VSLSYTDAHRCDGHPPDNRQSPHPAHLRQPGGGQTRLQRLLDAFLEPGTGGGAEQVRHDRHVLNLGGDAVDVGEDLTGGFLKRAGVGGGPIEAAEAFAASVGDGRKYLYGGVGPRYDCSGYMSDIYATLAGRSRGTRYFSTESAFESLGFVRGKASGEFNIGIRRGGGGRLSHMAGTMPSGVNVESGGSHGSTLYGGAAAGAASFPLQYFLPVTGGDPGGGAKGGGGPPGGGAGGGGGGTGGGGAGGTGGGAGGGGKGGGGGADLAKQFQKARAQDALDFASANVENAISGIKETLGLGDVFPDPTETPLFQSIFGGAKAFLPVLEGAMKGKLGIQEPGWKPGMPVKALSEGGGEGSGLSMGMPFGLPAIEIPEAPGPPETAAAGAQPTPNVQNNELNIRYEGNVGMGPDEINRLNNKAFDSGVSKLGAIDPGHH